MVQGTPGIGPQPRKVDPRVTEYAKLVDNVKKALREGGDFSAASQALLKFEDANPDVKGLYVEQSKDKPLNLAQQARKDKIEAQKLAEENAMKEVAKLQQEIAQMEKDEAPATAIAAKKAELEVAQKALDVASRPVVVREDGVETKGIKVETDNGEKSTAAAADLKVPTEKMERHTKRQEKAEMARYYDEKTGTWIEAARDGNGELRTDKGALRQAKHDLKAKEKEIKQDAKDAKKAAKGSGKEFKDAFAEFHNAQALHEAGQLSNEDYEAAAKKFNEAQENFTKLQDAKADTRKELSQVRQARKAAQGKGIGGDKRAFNKNVKANNRIVDREVYYTQAEADAAIAEGSKKKNVKVATADDILVLGSLQAAAKNALDKGGESLDSQAVWQELATLLVDENGNPTDKPDYRKIQDALLDLTGGDMKLDYTEQQMIQAETGMSNKQVRHLFETYGFEAPNPLGKRIGNGLKAAAPVAATMGIAALLSKHKSKATAHAEDHQHAESTSEAFQRTVAEDTQTAVARAEAWTEDQVYSYIDQYGRTRDLRIAGQYASSEQSVTAYAKAVAEARAKATATADAFASATAVAEAAAALSPAGIVAAPVLAFLAGFAKMPAESSAAKGATTEKMATYVEVFNKNKNKNIGNQIIQMEGQITGDKALDKVLIVAVLDHDIGSQNTVPTTRELRAALEHLKAIQREVTNMKTVVETPPKEEPEVHDEVEEDVCVDIEEQTVDNGTTLKDLRLRTGRFYLSNAYVVDGKDLTPKQRQEVMDKLKDLAKFADNKLDVNLPNEITLDDGTVVKLADKARDRIMNMDAKGGGRDPNYDKGNHATTQYRGKTCDGQQTGQWRNTAEEAWQDAEGFRKPKKQ